MTKFIIALAAFAIIFSLTVTILKENSFPETTSSTRFPPPQVTSPTPSPQIRLATPPSQKLLPNNYHIFQTFNNCGPAALSMALSYYDINVSQQTLGQELRPYQVPGGNNDDKSVTLEELAEKAKDYGLVSYHRPNGTVELIKLFIAYDIPIVARTLTKPTEDIGHYRIVKGYDEVAKQIIQDDSLQAKNLRFSYEDIDMLWQQFNYEYLVLVPPEKQIVAETILGEDLDPKTAWKKATQNAQKKLAINPEDMYAHFNLSVGLYNSGDFQRSVAEFEKVEHQLPFRTLWYQIEPILAYYELGDYERVFDITNRVLNNHNHAFSELYLLRGEIFLKQGNREAARNEFEKAVLYNQNLKAAQEAVEKITFSTF